MVKDRKKSSSSAAKVVADVPTPPVRSSSAAEKGTKLRRSHEKKKKKKRIVKLENEIVKLRKELENLQKINDEQKNRIRKTEHALQFAEEELMKVESEVTAEVKELMEDMEDEDDDDAPLEIKDDDLPLHIYEMPWQNRILPEDSKTLYATNLGHPEGRKLVEADFEEFFREVGKVVNVQIQLDPKKLRIVDFAKIEFESHDVANEAMKMHGRWFLSGLIELNGVPKLKHNERPIISCFGFGKAILGYKLERELLEYVSSVGEIIHVHAPVDDKALSVGCAYIHFNNEESVYKAFDLNGTLFLGSPLQVRRAKIVVNTY